MSASAETPPSQGESTTPNPPITPDATISNKQPAANPLAPPNPPAPPANPPANKPVADETVVDEPVADEPVEAGLSTNPILDVILTKSNLILLVWFLVIYILAYFVLGMFFGSGPTVSNFQASLGRLLDIIFLCGLLGYALLYYYYTPTDQFNSDAQQLYEQTIKYLQNSFSLLTTAAFIVVFYVVVYLFRIPMSDDAKPIFISFVENTAWIGLLLVSIVAFFKHVLGISLDDLFDRLNWFAKHEAPAAAPIPEEDKNEVFNISNNLYTYDDAQAVCSAFDAKLATYDQIESAYNAGAEWCAYGWSEDQMAFFPTQNATWSKLQKDPKTKNNCGRPGVNGGYIANPYIKFGVNCYGKKPKPTDADLNRLDAKQNQVFPKSTEDKKLDERVKNWKENADKFLQVSSYNTTKWSRY
jgi:hypothetical protein